MSKSAYSTQVNPSKDDSPERLSALVLTKIPELLPGHVLEITSSYHKRGTLKNNDRRNRSCYLKLDCRIVDKSGKLVQVFNRFVLLDPTILAAQN